MEFTGERVIPGQTDPDLLNEHIARYGFAESLVSERRVLDAGCGVGYGAKRLARRATSVAAVDVALEPLRLCRSEYGAANVSQCQGDCARLPFASESFDVVVAFEAIEHLEDPGAFLDETARVLVPSGQLIVSTPNRDYYAESRAEANPFHVREFNYVEFREELEQRFPHVTLFLENHNNAITFTPLEVKGVRTTLETAVPEPAQAHFFVAVCSRQPLYGSPAFVYLPQSGNVLRDREKHIHLLKQEVIQKEQWLAETTKELKQLDEIHRAEQREAQEAITALEKENEEKVRWAKQIKARFDKELLQRTKWAESLEADVEEARDNFARLETERDEIVAKLRALLEGAEAQAAERTKWAESLEADVEEARDNFARLETERDEIVAKLRALLEGAEAQAAERTKWAESLEADVEEARDNFARLETERDEIVAKLRALLEGAEAQAAERTEWAQRLDRELAEAREQLAKIYGSLAYRLGKRVGLAPLPPAPKTERK